jgi:hypothetical protein
MKKCIIVEEKMKKVVEMLFIKELVGTNIYENLEKYPDIQPDIEQLRNDAYTLQILALNGDVSYYNQLGKVTLLMREIDGKLGCYDDYRKSRILFEIF